MTYDTPDTELPADLLVSRFNNAHLVRVNVEARLIAVWNGSETINLYTFTLDELRDGSHNIPREEGEPASREEVNEFIDELFEEYGPN